MITTLTNLTAQIQDQWESIQNWDQTYSTTSKIMQIAALILGTSLLLPIALIPLTTESIITLSCSSAVSIMAALILLTNPSIQSEVKPGTWQDLQRKTDANTLDVLPINTLNHRSHEIRVPRNTVVGVDYQYLHANRVGEGLTPRPIIAAQAPIHPDYELFWKTAFSTNSTIIDLTTAAERETGEKVTPCYPFPIGTIMEHGSMRIRLQTGGNNTFSYLVENTETRERKLIVRDLYPNWEDGARIPTSTLDTITQQVLQLLPSATDPLWIHCTTGVGRTGTLITALILKEKIDRKEIKKENLATSLVDLIVELRKQRGPEFVQFKTQFDSLMQYGIFLLS